MRLVEIDSSASPVVSYLGLAFLYTSAYFLPLVSTTGAYFFPSNDYLSLIVLPSLAAIILEACLGYFAVRIVRRFLPSAIIFGAAVVLFAAFATIALKGILEVAGVDWENRVPRGDDLLQTLRLIKVCAFLIFFGLAYFTRYHLSNWLRGLRSIGLAFGGYATLRLLIISIVVATPNNSITVSRDLSSSSSMTSSVRLSTADKRLRRVVWLILDEADFDRIYGKEIEPGLQLPHFRWLADHAAFALNAYSPSSATLFSIPALLTGTPLSKDGVSINRYGTLLLGRADGTRVAFNERDSIFGTLHASGRSASLLGFYHPYCRLFVLERCDEFAWPAKIGMSEVFWSTLPAVVSTRFGHGDAWTSVTEDSLRLLPDYLTSEDSLTFIHLNIPHLPAVYADHLLHVSASRQPLTEYARNLQLCDQVLQLVIDTLRGRASGQALLLVVSSDHWLRNRWYRPAATEVMRRVPFIVWNVGETVGVSLSEPLNTVHTADMILAYLNGVITTQAQIAAWWALQPFDPSVIAPQT